MAKRAPGDLADRAEPERRVSVFDSSADRYDAWYDTPTGHAVFAAERAALEPLLTALPRPWIEVGVGGGRFASALEVPYGVDPSAAALALARRRGIETMIARGEELPLEDGVAGAVLLVVTLCFVDDPLRVLREARRALRPDGGIVLGLVPADGPWGRHYRALGAAGHAYYARARFFTREDLRDLLTAAGLEARRFRSALFWQPDGAPLPEEPRDRDDRSAGFLALLAVPGSDSRATAETHRRR